MKKIRIITDSNSGISQAEAKQLGIFVIPMPFTVNGEEFLEEISMSQEKFYELLAQNADVTTSQPSQFYLEELWTEELKSYDEILYIPMSSGLSATCENAKRYAENFDGKVFVVDNLRISITQKESVMEAIALLKMGRTASEIKGYLESTKDKNSIYITVGTLKYLKKGGRISAAAALLGSMLNAKPILSSRGLKFEKYGLVLALSQAKKKMIEKIRSELQTEFKQEYDEGRMVLSIAHTKNEKEAEKFKNEVLKEFPKLSFHFVDPLSLSVACHIGPGSLALAISVNNFQTL
ncbi:MAG: DegV family protein [Clostridia bacterium]|nr:DegV family protein [Clostridia bacterium]